MYQNLLLCLASLFPPAYAQAAEQTRTPPAPTGVIGLIVLYICVSRRRQEIGGWLLYFYIQLYIGVIVTLLVATLSFHNYLPTAWQTAPHLYLWFLLSTVPGIIITPLQLVLAERLRLSRDYRFVLSLRLVLWIDLAAAVLAIAIDLTSFQENLAFDIIAIAWPLIWLPYFYVSKRVVRVFRTKDWLPTTPPAPAA